MSKLLAAASSEKFRPRGSPKTSYMFQYTFLNVTVVEDMHLWHETYLIANTRTWFHCIHVFSIVLFHVSNISFTKVEVSMNTMHRWELLQITIKSKSFFVIVESDVVLRVITGFCLFDISVSLTKCHRREKVLLIAISFLTMIRFSPVKISSRRMQLVLIKAEYILT